MKTCRFHPETAPFCPILRVGDVVQFAGQDFTKLASTVSTGRDATPQRARGRSTPPPRAGSHLAASRPQGGVLGIKIGWVCDLDRAWDQCIPKYSFTRLDGVSEKSSVSPGYNFR